MGAFNVIIGEVIEDCPDITIPDLSNYTSGLVFPYSDFKFHDYDSGNPTINTEFTLDTFVFGAHAFTGVSIVINTDGASNIINPEAQYIALTSALNAASGVNQEAVFVQPPDTGYRDWYIRIAADISTGYAGQAVSVNVNVGMTPDFDTITSSVPVSVRNLTLLNRDGIPVDLGAVAQQDELVLSGVYTEGETFQLDFCNDIVTYEVTSDNSDECVALGIEEAIAAKIGGLFSTYVEVSRESGVLTFDSKESGVPLQIDVTFSGSETFNHSTIIDNVPSMSTPGFTSVDEVVYETIERGGKYTAILTVVSECDYNVDNREFFSWCYDLSQLDCCFVSLVQGAACCCKSKDRVRDASTIRNVMRSVDIMRDKGSSESDIQKVVDLGWSICEPLKCSCSDC